MKQKVTIILVKFVEKIVEGVIILTGGAIKIVCLLLAFGFCLEDKRLEMLIYIISGYIFQIMYYKVFLFPYINPIPNEKSKR